MFSDVPVVVSLSLGLSFASLVACWLEVVLVLVLLLLCSAASLGFCGELAAAAVVQSTLVPALSSTTAAAASATAAASTSAVSAAHVGCCCSLKLETCGELTISTELKRVRNK